MQKAPLYRFLHVGVGPGTNSAIDKEVHRHKCGVLAHGFSETALKDMEGYMIANVDHWCELLGENNGQKADTWSEPKDIAKYCNYLTFDVLGELCFGKSFGMSQSTVNRWVPKMMMTRLFLFHTVSRAATIDLALMTIYANIGNQKQRSAIVHYSHTGAL